MRKRIFSVAVMTLFVLAGVSARAETTPAASTTTSTTAPAPSGSSALPTGTYNYGNNGPKLDEPPLLERFPELNKFIHKEKASSLYFGFGVSPVTIVNGKIGFAASIFQLHYVKQPWDLELLNLSFGNAFGDDLGKEQFFLVRSTPKFRIFKNFSVGPVIGIEFVHFPNVQAAVHKNVPGHGDLFSEQFDFSTFGYFYGGGISQTFELSGAGDKAIRVSAIYYRERYSVNETRNGWNYYFLQNELNSNKDAIAPSSMLMLEISYLY